MTGPRSELEERFIGLETKLAFLERSVGSLDEHVRALSAENLELRRQVARLERLLRARAESSGAAEGT